MEAIEPIVGIDASKGRLEGSPRRARGRPRACRRGAPRRSRGRRRTCSPASPASAPSSHGRLIAELPELGSLERRAVAALAPWTRQSGRWRGKSLIGDGRTAVRTILYLGALVPARRNPTQRAFRDRLRARGKPKIVAIIATARKLLNAIISDKTPWRTKMLDAKDGR